MPLNGLKSFRMRLLIGVVVPVFLIQSSGVALELSQLKIQYHKTLVTEAEMLTELVGESMVLPLWDFDMPQVINMIDRLLEENPVGAVRLVGPDNAVLAENKTEWFSPATSNLTISHELKYDYGGQQETLGTLFVTLTTDSVTSALHQSIVQKIIVSACILSLIAASLVVVLSRLAQPLAAMSDTIAGIGNGDLDRPVPGIGRTDEIGMVAKALDQWRKDEAEVTALRAQNDESARRERRRIRRALESTHDGVLLANEGGTVVFCNPKATKFFTGVKAGKVFDFRHWLDPETALRIDQAIQGKNSFQLETILTTTTKTERLNLLVRGGPILDATGGFLGTVVLATDHTEQARQAEQARYLSEHDSLTGLPNRRLMEETLDRWVTEATENTSILLADLDRFKLINDTLGHPTGDALLKRVAQAFRAQTGQDELAARLGGDEFSIVARGPDSATRLTGIARRLIDELSHPQQVEGQVLHTGLSIGISTVRASDRNPLDGVRRADLALYDAKNKGRGRFEVFHSDLEAVVQRKTLLDSELRKALRNKEILPVYQMQTDLNSRDIVGFETLARWAHPTLGTVSPAEFISIAEETGLIGELTHQIMIEACKTALIWKGCGFAGRVAVNISPKLFGGRIEEFVRDCLLITGCPASAIEIEITETVVLSDGTSARQEIEALQKLGVTIALDDFGMGYSSLSYLQKFPVNKIKIDRAFVSKLPVSAETRAIVKAITDLGHALGMQVTGEGAETEAHRQCLQECSVDYLQGFVDGPPMTRDVATATLADIVQRARA